uniref:Predicted protein n=1 Tax=Hordeum vulgare subsp. vulgare TaxID=112509 RepID=F2DCB5_HORVV|nr:predicted protein [Hordeum vulgare subsp. vulgare]
MLRYPCASWSFFLADVRLPRRATADGYLAAGRPLASPVGLQYKGKSRCASSMQSEKC